jgi:competence CoiA-like predicted nuclease
MLARMKNALLKSSDKKTITADEAVAKGERRAFCPKCKHPVRLHRCKKIASHFEHSSVLDWIASTVTNQS